MKKIIIKNRRIFVHWIAIPLIATCMILWPTYSSSLEILQTDPGDTLFNAYILEHAFQHLTSADIFTPHLFWSPEFFWPIKDTLSWSDHLLGQSIIYGIFRTILNPINAYVCWLSATLILNYVSIRRAIEKISPQTIDIWLSVIALTTAFSPAITGQIGHPQLLSFFIIGPVLYECHRLITGKPEDYALSSWLYLACLLLINGFFNIYTFVYACYGVLICAAIHITRRISRRANRLKIGDNIFLAAACLTTLVAMNAYIYFPYLNTLELFGSRPIEEIIISLPKPAGWMLGNDWLLLQPPWTNQTINPDWISGREQTIFPGWGLLILLSASVLSFFSKQKMLNSQNWLVAVLLMIFLTLSFNGVTAWPLMMKLLPGSSSLRASSRIAMMIILFSAPFISIAAQCWKLSTNSLLNIFNKLTIFLASFATIWAIPGKQYQFNYGQWEKELHAISNKLIESDCDVFWYEWQKNMLPFRAQVLAMHAQSMSKIPTANGYSGQFPNGYWPFTNHSGQNAFTWLSQELPLTNHLSKEIKYQAKKCIINLNDNSIASVRYYQKQKIAPYEIIFNRDGIKVGSDGQRLYALIRKDINGNQDDWIRLSRNGKPIPAQRGKYQIVDVEIKEGSLFITDRNSIEKNQYVWQIDSQTGVFLNQEFENLRQ